MDSLVRQALALGTRLAMLLGVSAAPAAAGTLPSAGVPQSCGVQLKTHNFKPTTLDAVHDAGFRIVRRGFYWNAVEKEQGRYDFSAYDAAMDRAQALGLRVLVVLFSGHPLYGEDRGGIQTEAGRRGFAAFAAALAAHYRGRNVLYEIWNEPNVRTFWRKNGQHNSEAFAQEYTALVKAVAPAMLAADPDAFILAGSVSNYWPPSYEWTEACFKQGILDTGIGGWSVHPYGVKTPEEFAVGHGITRKLLGQYGHPALPMVDSERGFATAKPQGQLEQEGWSGGELTRLRDHQAAHFVRQFMVDQLHGLPLTVWYEWDGDEFGIKGREPEPRPIETAARFLMRHLAGYRLERRLPAADPLDYLVVWRNAEGRQILVAWTAPAPGGSPDQARPHAMTLAPTPPLGGYRVHDLYGQAATVERLTLTASPQYVDLPAGVE